MINLALLDNHLENISFAWINRIL